jgi:Uma2 family endonuclease
MSYEEFLEWLDEETHAEWVDGEIVMMAPVADSHSDLSSFLLTLIRVFVDTGRLGRVLAEPYQMKTGPDLPGRSPDILFVRNEHRSSVTKHFLNGPADLVVEIISPDSRHRDRVEKFEEYQQGGVSEYWLLDPNRQKADFYTRGADARFRPIEIADGTFRSVVLAGLWLKVDWLWQDPLPPVTDIIKQWGLV